MEESKSNNVNIEDEDVKLQQKPDDTDKRIGNQFKKQLGAAIVKHDRKQK